MDLHAEVEEGFMETGRLPVYLRLEEAADLHQVDAPSLLKAVEAGTIHAIKTPEGDVLVSKADVGVLRATASVDPDLSGKPIRLGEAAHKYKIEYRSLSRWAYAGYVRILEQAPKILLLDEADVKRAAEIFHQARRDTGSYVQAGWILKRVLNRELSVAP